MFVGGVKRRADRGLLITEKAKRTCKVSKTAHWWRARCPDSPGGSSYYHYKRLSQHETDHTLFHVTWAVNTTFTCPPVSGERGTLWEGALGQLQESSHCPIWSWIQPAAQENKDLNLSRNNKFYGSKQHGTPMPLAELRFCISCPKNHLQRIWA